MRWRSSGAAGKIETVSLAQVARHMIVCDDHEGGAALTADVRVTRQVCSYTMVRHLPQSHP